MSGFGNNFCDTQDEKWLEACCCNVCIYTFALPDSIKPTYNDNATCPFFTCHSCLLACIMGSVPICVPIAGTYRRLKSGDDNDKKCCSIFLREWCCTLCYCAPCAMAHHVRGTGA